MAAAETARLIASLELKDKLSKGVQGAQKSLGGFESRWDKVAGKVKAGLAIGAGAVALFGVQQVKAGLEALTEVENAVGQVDGSLREVAPTWKTTGAEIARIANRIEADVEAAFDDKDIIKGAGALIRYGKLTEGNLEPALAVMTDLAAKTGSVESASSLLAKALADPAKAAGKLSRAGVVLTKEQQKQVKAMTEAGDVAGAQAYLLEQLAQTTKGAARNLYGPAADAQNELNDAVEDGQKLFAEGFLPVITRVRKALGKGLADPTTMSRIRDLGRGLADGFDSLLDIAGKLPWGTIGDSLALAGSGAKAVLSAFTSMPAWVQTAVLTGWGLNKLSGGLVGELGKGLIKGVLGMNAGVVNIKAGVVTGAGGVPGLPGGASPVATAAGMGTAAALGIGGGAVAAAIIGAVNSPAWVKAGVVNTKLQSQGLTPAEIAAQKYYTASAADQAEMRKRISILPSRADFASGNAKLQEQSRQLDGAAQRRADDAKRASDAARTAIERGREAQLETKRESTRGTGVLQSSIDRSADTIRNGFSLIPPPMVSVNVAVSPTTINKVTNVTNRYGNTSGDRHTNHNAGRPGGGS